jgi:hypothetical protein
MDSFWDSGEGREYRDAWRQVTTARGGVDARPRAKGAGGAQRERDLIMAAARAWHSAHHGGWPRPKAEVALDVWAVARCP